MAKIRQERVAALVKAAEDLERIVEELTWVLGGDNAVYSRSFEAVRQIARDARSDADFELRLGHSETGIGNDAAFELGAYVEKTLGILREALDGA